MADPIPPLSGSYALRLVLPQPLMMAVGRLGPVHFPAGMYIYCGSAHGPGGLRARLLHHSRVAVRPHWHIDWLRAESVFEGGWYAAEPGPLECAWSQALAALPGAAIPAPGFGAADCQNGCPAHLLAFPGELDLALVCNALAIPIQDRSVLKPFGPVFSEEKTPKSTVTH